MKRTPLHQEHVRLGARMTEFGGWEMPVSYPGGILAEHLATRKFGGLFDISHMGRFAVRGRGALPFLQYALASNVAAMRPGECQYSIIADEEGGAVDDAFLYHVGPDDYLLVVNAANAEADWTRLRGLQERFDGCALDDLTADVAMVALQGPRAKAVLAAVVEGGRGLPGPLRNRLAVCRMFGSDVPAATTGYTGEPVGFELFPPSEAAARVWAGLMEAGQAHGVVAVGLGARDTLRLEAGLPLHGHEHGRDPEGNAIPVLAVRSARLAVSFASAKGEYVGRAALLRQAEEVSLRARGLLGPAHAGSAVPRVVVPLALADGSVARAGCPVAVDGAAVGVVTSGTVVPYWRFDGDGVRAQPGAEWGRRAIALAYVNAGLEAGQAAKVDIRGRPADGVIVRRNLSSVAPPYARPLLASRPACGGGAEARATSGIGLARALIARARDNTEWRQRQTINLIPSEQTPSLAVRLLSIADPVGRYAEHRHFGALGDTDVFYYQGTRFIAEVEELLCQEMRRFLGCSQVEPRVISGQMANAAVFSGLVRHLNRDNRRVEPRRLRSVLNHHIGAGGHLSAQAMGALADHVAIDPVTERPAVVSFPLSRDNPYTMDLAAAADLIEACRPELIVLGKSMVLHPEPVGDLSRLIADMSPRPVLMYDTAHVFGLLGPHFQEPLAEGADIVTASMHKTFFGTQRGLIASNMDQASPWSPLWESIVRRVFPGSVSNHHLGTLLGLLMAAYEMREYGGDYQRKVLVNAKALARALKDEGMEVEGDPDAGYTETHQVVVRVGYGKGPEVAERLERSDIVVNYQALPDDEAFTASSGLRMGVQEMTRFGMEARDFQEAAACVADVVLRGKDAARRVRDLRARFTIMRYCLPPEEARPLATELLGGLTAE